MATLNYDYSFTPNTPAKASEVNSNFNKVKEFVESISNGTNIDAGAISTTKILDGAVNTDKLANSAVTNSKLDYNSVPRTTVSQDNPTGGKNGDIWVKVV